MINVAIMGHGVVGSGTAEILINHPGRIEKATHTAVNVKYILDLREFPGLSYSDKFVKDFNIILNDESVRVVAEVMGGINPAYDFVKKCLEKGKSVVTSNKELVAAKGAELLKIAAENNANFLFEASVGGGIPVLRPISQCLAANEITEISGILNGTTNYILNKMIVENMDFDSALALAQKKGFAEKNPAADIEGHDACRKIAILTSLVSGQRVDFEDIYTEGITKVTAEDIMYADKLGRVIKLLAMSKKEADGKYYAMVAPFLIDAANPLYSVNGVFNAIFVEGNMLGDSMFYGSGAGKLPTASAVVGDMITAVRSGNDPEEIGWSSEKLEVHPASELSRKYFARFEGSERAKKEVVEAAFGDVKFVTLEGKDEFAVLTGEMTGEEFDAAAAKVGGLRQKIAARL